VSIEWKMPAIAAAAAFVLAILIGIFAGASFWTLLLRSFLTGIGSGLAAFGLRWLAVKFLEAPAQEAPGRETGRNVDLRVGDEAAPEARAASDERAAQEERAARAREERPATDEGEAAVERADEAVSAEDESPREDILAEELEELKASPILKEAEEEERTYAPVRPPEAIDDVDVLPDLDVFTDAFAPPSVDGGESEAPVDAAPSRPSGGGGKGAAAGDDPGVLAQAVRTILTRERKG